MEWYDGPSLLHHLEEVYIASDRNLIDCRFPVQYVIRPKSNAHHDYRGYAGHDRRRRVQARRRRRGAALRLHLDDPVHRHRRRPGRRGLPAHVGHDDARRRRRREPGRHDLPAAQPRRASARSSTRWCAGSRTNRSCAPAPSWRSSTRRARRGRSSATCSTGSTSTSCTATRTPNRSALNEIGRITLRTTAPLFFDEYRRNRTTGSFILIDETTNNTVGAGMILGEPD